MRRYADPDHGERLAAAEEVAEPWLRALGFYDRDPETVTSMRPGPVRSEVDLDGPLAGIPAAAIPDVRIALLRRISESELGTSGSSHDLARARLASMARLGVRDLALELALCRFALDLGAGVGLSRLRLGLLDPTIADLGQLPDEAATSELLESVARTAELLVDETLGTEVGSIDRRFGLLAFLQRQTGGALPALAFNAADPFGAAMRTVLETDAGMPQALGLLLPLAAKATSTLPVRREQDRIDAIGRDAEIAGPARDGVARCLRQLMIAPLTPRGPGFVTIRPANQRLARAAMWLVPALLPTEAPDLLGRLGLWLGTSGKSDNQARDTALAGTCAALLGALDLEDATASLARMLANVRNRPVRKQVEKALAASADRRGIGVDAMVEDSLPSFGLDADGRRSVEVAGWAAQVRLDGAARVHVTWTSPEGRERQELPRELIDPAPGGLADVRRLVDEIRATLSEERRRLEGFLAETRRWDVAAWRRRYAEHPVARVHAFRLIWRFHTARDVLDGLPSGAALLDEAGQVLAIPDEATVELWHPVEAEAASVEAWRDLLVARLISQPIKQAFRETYAAPDGGDAVLDARHGDRPLAYAQLRALLGSRGWRAPMLGPHDQGDRSVAYRDFRGAGIRAEFTHLPAGVDDERERVTFVRSGSLRFVIDDDGDRRLMLLRDVPPRIRAEALRDVDLFTSVPDPLRRPAGEAGPEPPIVATRAAALRRIIPSLPTSRQLSVVGAWLRIERGPDAWLISLETGRTLRLPEEDEEEDDEVAARSGDAEAAAVIPFEDDVLERILATADALARGG